MRWAWCYGLYILWISLLTLQLDAPWAAPCLLVTAALVGGILVALYAWALAGLWRTWRRASRSS